MKKREKITHEDYEKILFGGKIPHEYDGRCRIGVKCDAERCKCELTVYRARGSAYEAIFTCAGVIGKNGAGKMAEGDAKTPYGTFTVGNAYGIKDDPGSIIPYTKVTEDMYWRCDASKPDYNTLSYASGLPADTDFSKDEHLMDYEGIYNYLLDIGYNSARVPYAGSAVFLHCMRNDNTPTRGCVAIPEEDMIKILRTIAPETQITIY